MYWALPAGPGSPKLIAVPRPPITPPHLLPGAARCKASGVRSITRLRDGPAPTRHGRGPQAPALRPPWSGGGDRGQPVSVCPRQGGRRAGGTRIEVLIPASSHLWPSCGDAEDGQPQVIAVTPLWGDSAASVSPRGPRVAAVLTPPALKSHASRAGRARERLPCSSLPASCATSSWERIGELPGARVTQGHDGALTLKVLVPHPVVEVSIQGRTQEGAQCPLDVFQGTMVHSNPRDGVSQR